MRGTSAGPDSIPGRGGAVVLCALRVEYLAVLAHLSGLQLYEHRLGTRFQTGRLAQGDQVVTLAMTGPGNVGAAILAERAIATFSPRVLLCVGVAGALKDDLELGDVVVGTRIDAYHGGTAAEDFRARPRTWEANHRLEQAARQCDIDGDWKDWLPEEARNSPPMVYFRPIASGEVVLDSRSSQLFSQLRLHNDDAAAVEMEGAGLAHAAHLNNCLASLVIRGISDHADGAKMSADRAGWQKRASANAAAFAMSLLDSFPASLSADGRAKEAAQTDPQRESVAERQRVKPLTRSQVGVAPRRAGDWSTSENPLARETNQKNFIKPPAVVVIMVAIAVIATIIGTKFLDGHTPGLAETHKASTSPSEAPSGLPNGPRSKRIGKYTLVLFGGAYSPLGRNHPTFPQVWAASAHAQGVIQWRWRSANYQFNSGNRDSMVKLPSRTSAPTFAACIDQTDIIPSVQAPPGSAFCIKEPGNIMAGVSVKTVDLSGNGTADLQIIVWKYSG